MAELTITDATKRFGPKTVLDRVSLNIRNGEFVALLGPSGCGKSTLLRLIAGFERLDDGSIHFSNSVMSGPGVHVPTEKRRLGMVFQSYALWPHMTVAENVEFALRVARKPKPERRLRVERALRTVGLTDFADRRPALLSGGQRQRVALARTLATAPAIVLLDEPLANLDANLRESMQVELWDFHRESTATTIFVTHDQAEALALADRVAVMIDGQICQFDDPATLYDRPSNPDVARFIGRGALVPVTVLSCENGLAKVRFGGGTSVLRAPAGTLTGPAVASLRPESCLVRPTNAICGSDPVAHVRHVRYTGPSKLVACALDDENGTELLATAERNMKLEHGQRVSIEIKDGWILPRDNGS